MQKYLQQKINLNMNIKNPLAGIKGKLKSKSSKPDKKKEVKIQDDRNRYITVLKILSVIVLITLASVFFATSFFVRKIIKNTIGGGIQSLEIYKADIGVDLINFDKLDKAEKNWEDKHKDSGKKINKDPFLEVVVKKPEVELDFLTEEELETGIIKQTDE
jgi:hypothetical protein